MELFGLTDIGRVRTNNEDTLRLEPELDAVALADGMGGEQCGEVASALAVEAVARALRSEAGLPPAERVRMAARLANQAVHARSRSVASCRGMGTTLVVALRDGGTLHLASVGDSRAYLFRDGGLRQLTRDQTVYEELRGRLGMSHEEACRYPGWRALTAAIGVDAEVAVGTASAGLEAGDLVLICSDGLFGPVPEGLIAEIMTKESDLRHLAEQLVAEANRRGGPDNVTVALMRVND